MKTLAGEAEPRGQRLGLGGRAQRGAALAVADHEERRARPSAERDGGGEEALRALDGHEAPDDQARSESRSSRVRYTKQPGRSWPGTGGTNGVEPVASTSAS